MKIDYNQITFMVAVLVKLLPKFISKEISKRIITGPRGYKGDQGYEGQQGAQGQDGMMGKNGLQGKRGTIGAQGLQGKNGERGLTGRFGGTGQRGLQGIDGHHGQQGDKGIIGDVGPQGDTGPQGETGLAPAHDWIGTKLLFQNPNGTGGKLVELRGLTGESGEHFYSDAIFGGQLIVIETDYITTGNIRLVAKNSLTVTLNATPVNDETVFIKMMDGDVLIKGNGRNIDGSATQTIFIKNTALRLMYAYDLNEWLVT